MLAYSGRGRFVVQNVDLNSLVEEMAHLLRVSIGKGVRLNYQFERDLPPVEGDATQLRQVVMNLVVNASDAIGENEGAIAITTRTIQATRELLAETYLAPSLKPGDYVALEVADTGSGMDAETISRIFDPFFTTKFTGRGLGLAAVLGIMRGHRGAIKVESEPGRGTTFRLLLPAAGADPTRSPARPPTAAWRGSGTVLVVDDEPSVRAVTARALTSFGFDVLEAADGVEGVETYAANRDRIVCTLLDMTMPRMGGEEAFRAIRSLDPAARVLLMSGFTEQDSLGRFAGLGLAGFVQKPYELSALRSAVQAALAATS
jgi:CheY-like chemotaxis protein/two-component sensor histidine kinase